MNTKYTIIESYSGLVWGTAYAYDIIDACRLLDEGIGEYGLTYEERGAGIVGSGQDHYTVYLDTTAIEYMADDHDAVRALPIAGYVTRSI